MTTVKTAVPVINEDIQAPENNLESLSYEPTQTCRSGWRPLQTPAHRCLPSPTRFLR